ncbi:DUF4783 domain-containing protein [Pedobacter sp. BS3]|uniref:DUF4783 domain-containing protein n=1 Tax=Pedobacter sp. BS3 TaxID=2567937 RepID=UPI0011EF8C74|nr:DUF4783 domain-containing protein [Pedobacter sp. BS3]TZF83734.1 DUF4783 domain-containing protein [Pedobacter sp. BS3]
MVKICCFILLLFAGNISFANDAADITDDVNNLIRTANTKELAKYFAGNVEITILNDEDVYSKSQAEIILKDFFAKHLPQSLKVIHKLTSNPNYRFNVLSLNTSNGVFRVSYSMKNFKGNFLITEIRIETNKE